MSNFFYTVSVYGGASFRILVTNCDGSVVEASDVLSIKYSVFRESFGTRTVVTGHENVTVPTSCFFATVQESDCTGEEFNFEHRVSAKTALPFPELNTRYIVVYTFYDTDGEPHPCELWCYTRSQLAK